jgi:hypothetical protein
MSYIVAIPTYNRVNEIIHKTLHTLYEGNVDKNKIYLFVANRKEYEIYEKNIPKNLYNKIIIGKKGITNQRIFISKYFKEGQFIVSMDDDVERLEMLRGDKLIKLNDLNLFFKNAFELLKKEKLNIWGIYPVRNPFFMYNDITTDLRFIIGVTFGYINRHSKILYPSIKAETKEDYEQTILFFKQDGGVLRFNNITAKTKFNAEGGLGTDRYERNKNAAVYLKNKYSDIITIFERKNGMPEVKLKRLDRIEK